MHSGESQGQRKVREFSGGGDEIAKKGRVKEGRPHKPSGMVLKMIQLDWEWQKLLISPADRNESPKLELPGAWKPSNSSRTSPIGERKEAPNGLFNGDKSSWENDGKGEVSAGVQAHVGG